MLSSSHPIVAVIGILGPTDFFGEGCLAGQPIRTATASAIERSPFIFTLRRRDRVKYSRHAKCSEEAVPVSGTRGAFKSMRRV